MRKLFLIFVTTLLVAGVFAIRSKSNVKNLLQYRADTVSTTSYGTSAVFVCTAPTEDTNWQYIPEFVTTTCAENTYLGGFGAGGSIRSTIEFSTPHRSVAVSFKLALIDSWDEETFRVTADGETVFSITHDYLDADVNQCGEQWADDFVFVRFGFNHTGYSVVLNFSSNLDSNSSDESWGLCDLKVNELAGFAYESGEEIAVMKDFTFSCAAPSRDENWNYYPAYQTAKCTGGTYVGGYGYDDSVEAILYIPRSHQALIISFRVAFIGTWAGEYFNLTVDGTTAYSVAYTNGEALSYDVEGSCEDSFSVTYRTVQFGVNHTSSTIALVFTSTLSNESSSDAAWGICNFFIQPKPNQVTPEGYMYGGVDLTLSTPFTVPLPNAFYNYIPRFDYIYCNSFYWIGPFGAGGYVTSSLKTQNHKSIWITFDLLLLDSWENETFTVSVDGETAYSYTHTHTPSGSNLCGSYWSDEVIVVKLGVNHTLDDVTIVLSSNLDSNTDDEGWAYSALSVNVYKGYVSSSGELLGFLKSPVFSCVGPTYDADWTYAPTFATTTCGGNVYVGGYSSGGTINATYFFLQFHHGLIVQMNLAIIGPWENNSLIVEVDNKEAYRFTYTYDESEVTSCDESSSYAYLPAVTFGVNHSAWGLLFNISSDIDSDEISWGVCSLEITPTWGTVDYQGNELNANSIKTLSCSQPAEDLGWIYAPSYDTVTCSSNINYVGDFGVGGSLESSLRVPDAHNGIIVSFNLAVFDSWEDNSAIYVTVDSDIVYVIEPADYNSTVLSACNDSYNYTSVNVTFGFNHSLNTLNFEIASTLSENSLDQSWGICDISIISTTDYVTVDGNVIALQ